MSDVFASLVKCNALRSNRSSVSRGTSASLEGHSIDAIDTSSINPS